MTTADNVLSWREFAKSNNFPLSDQATWTSDSKQVFPKSLILDINLFLFYPKGTVGLKSIVLDGKSFQIVFADALMSSWADATVLATAVLNTPSEIHLSLRDKHGRPAGIVILDGLSVLDVLTTKRGTYTFDTVANAVTPNRFTRLGEGQEMAISVDDQVLTGTVRIMAADGLYPTANKWRYTGDSFAEMTDELWRTRRKSLTRLNGITGQTSASVVISPTDTPQGQSIYTAIRGGALYFGLRGLE